MRELAAVCDRAACVACRGRRAAVVRCVCVQCSRAESALLALLSSNFTFVCLFQSKQTHADASRIYFVMAAAPARRPVAPSSKLELGISLGQGANCACVEAFDIHTGQVWAAKIYNDEHDTSAQDKVSRVLAAEDLCEGWSCPSLLSCSATSGKGACTVLLYRLMDGTIAAHFHASPLAGRLLAARSAVRHLLVVLHHLHSRGLCHGDVHIENALVCGS